MYKKFLMMFLAFMISGMIFVSCSDDDGGTTTTPDPDITLISPNGGDVVQMGTSVTITWEDFDGDSIKIELYKGGVFSAEIESSFPNVGAYTYTIPTDLAAGIDYKIKITSTVNSDIFDFSDVDFTIVSVGEYIVITAPNGGETYQAGTSQTLTWEDNIVENVVIEVYYDGVYIDGTATETESDGIFIFDIPSDAEPGALYKIKVTSVVNAGISDFSNNNFTITESAPRFITVLSPNGGEIWEAGQTYEITWEDNVDGNVIIEAYQDGVYIDSTAIVTESDGSFFMDIPGNTPSITNLQFKILSEDDPSVFDYSDSYFEIIGIVEGTGSYNLDGVFVEATGIQLNMDSGDPQHLQFNIRNNVESPRHQVQIGTIYTSKLSFDDAFVNNMLVLNDTSISDVGMEFDGSYHSFTRNAFSMNVTLNDDGTYDFTSSGSISDGTKTVTNITGENVSFKE